MKYTRRNIKKPNDKDKYDYLSNTFIRMIDYESEEYTPIYLSTVELKTKINEAKSDLIKNESEVEINVIGYKSIPDDYKFGMDGDYIIEFLFDDRRPVNYIIKSFTKGPRPKTVKVRYFSACSMSPMPISGYVFEKELDKLFSEDFRITKSDDCRLEVFDDKEATRFVGKIFIHNMIIDSDYMIKDVIKFVDSLDLNEDDC